MKHIFDGDQLLLVLEALSNPYRLKIIAILFEERKYVSQLARELGISRPLLYLHLKKLEEANLVSSVMEVSDSGKAMNFYTVNDFHFNLQPSMIHHLATSLTIKKKDS